MVLRPGDAAQQVLDAVVILQRLGQDLDLSPSLGGVPAPQDVVDEDDPESEIVGLQPSGGLQLGAGPSPVGRLLLQEERVTDLADLDVVGIRLEEIIEDFFGLGRVVQAFSVKVREPSGGLDVARFERQGQPVFLDRLLQRLGIAGDGQPFQRRGEQSVIFRRGGRALGERLRDDLGRVVARFGAGPLGVVPENRRVAAQEIPISDIEFRESAPDRPDFLVIIGGAAGVLGVARAV